jgi:hypothetical protein
MPTTATSSPSTPKTIVRLSESASVWGAAPAEGLVFESSEVGSVGVDIVVPAVVVFAMNISADDNGCQNSNGTVLSSPRRIEVQWVIT